MGHLARNRLSHLAFLHGTRLERATGDVNPTFEHFLKLHSTAFEVQERQLRRVSTIQAPIQRGQYNGYKNDIL